MGVLNEKRCKKTLYNEGKKLKKQIKIENILK